MVAVSMGVEREVRVGTDFGDALRGRRLAAGWSEIRLATTLGVRLSEVRVWETGGAIPPPAVVRALARVLHLDSRTAREWLTWAGAEPPPMAAIEVSIHLLPGEAPADPFANPHVVVDLNARRPNDDAPPAIRQPRIDAASRRLPPTRPAPATPVVFPSPRTATVVYSDGPASPAPSRRTGWIRQIVVALALVGLGLLLWWAFGELGQGLSKVVDRLGGALGVIAPG